MSDNTYLGLLVGIGFVLCAMLGAVFARLGHLLQTLERLERPTARGRHLVEQGEGTG